MTFHGAPGITVLRIPLLYQWSFKHKTFLSMQSFLHKFNQIILKNYFNIYLANKQQIFDLQ